MAQVTTRKIVLGVHRVSYVHLAAPATFPGQEAAEYSTTFLIDQDSPDVDKIEQAMLELYKENPDIFGGLPFNSPKIWNPLRSGDEIIEEKPDRTEYDGKLFIKAKSKSQPVLFDQYGEEAIDYNLAYSGSYCRGVIVLRPYNNAGKRGFSVFLNSVKFMKDGERLGASSASHDDYEDDRTARTAQRTTNRTASGAARRSDDLT